VGVTNDAGRLGSHEGRSREVISDQCPIVIRNQEVAEVCLEEGFMTKWRVRRVPLK